MISSNLTLSHQSGFTLVELMVVVVILSVFAGMLTLSVGSTESRKHRAFYEHMVDSLTYVRLLSAEQMQPMGMVLQVNKNGQTQPVVVELDNAYAPFAQNAYDAQKLNAAASGVQSDNSMQLTAMRQNETDKAIPQWVASNQVDLPSIPNNVTITVVPAESNSIQRLSNTTHDKLLPWFNSNDVPQALWFGTGEAAPVDIEIRHNKRLVGNIIHLLPDGRISTEPEQTE